MLNLIKNEYAKLFHKKSTYLLLAGLLLAIIALPLLSKYIKNSNIYFYSTTYEEEIHWAKESGDKVSAEMYTKAEELEIPIEDFFNNSLNWKVSALNELYYNYWEYAYNSENDTSLTETEKDNYKTLFENGLKYVEDNDWKGYYQYKIDTINNDSALSAIEKENNIYVYQYMLDKNIDPGSDSWQGDVLATYSSSKTLYDTMLAAKESGEYYSEKDFISARNSMLIAKYRLDNNINAAIYEGSEEEIAYSSDIYIYTGELFNNMKNGVGLLIIVLIIIIIAAGNIISKEFSQGTIKFLLINPVKRSKIFWSKYITVFSYALLLTLATFVLETIMSLIVFGGSEFGTKLLLVEGGKVIAQSGIIFIFGRFMLAFIEIVIAFTIAFMISSLFRNSALAIALSMIIYFVGSTACEIAAMFNLDFFRYTIFATQDMTSIVNGKSMFLHLTPVFASVVIVIHLVLLLLTAHDAFTKKNV